MQLLYDDFFTDIIANNLMLYVDIPESSGVDLAHLSSPIVTLARYEGNSAVPDAPKWTQMPVGVVFEFRQPCKEMADLFFKIALSAENFATVSQPLFE